MTSTLTPSKGKVIAVRDGIVIFSPTGTNYEMHLACPAYVGPVDVPVRGIIRVQPRKIWTVPAGGLFVSPIFGTPRIIQGRIRALDEKTMTLHAGGEFVVDLPADDRVYDLANGALTVGAMVNVTALPGVSFELIAV